MPGVMPVTDQQVIDALRPLAGPDAPVGMVELGMVSEVRVRRHRVAVTLAHPDGPA
ncbi:MAG: iron-sulfur cluster assembly protein, partial [Acidimicrobiales bacterium]